MAEHNEQMPVTSWPGSKEKKEAAGSHRVSTGLWTSSCPTSSGPTTPNIITQGTQRFTLKPLGDLYTLCISEAFLEVSLLHSDGELESYGDSAEQRWLVMIECFPLKKSLLEEETQKQVRKS